jgi:hypothetical protein
MANSTSPRYGWPVHIDAHPTVSGWMILVFVAASLTIAFPARAQTGSTVPTWTPWKSDPQPPPRGAHALAYDVARGRLVVFGGRPDLNATSLLSDTQEWEGTAWIKRSPASSPSPREGHTLVYDTIRQRVVLFGGCDAAGTSLNDQWEWDGMNWLEVQQTARPSARCFSAAAYDRARRRIVLHGGVSLGDVFRDTWEWDGTNWTDRSGPLLDGGFDDPGPQAWHALAYDPARGVTVMFGSGATGQESDTWEWDGLRWALKATDGPEARMNHGLSYDEIRSRTVLFGGYGIVSGHLQDTWEWDGARWMLVTPPHAPTSRQSAMLTYDSASHRVMLFGGSNGEIFTNDLWAYDGADWTPLTANTSSASAYQASIAYDRQRGTTVLLGVDSWTWEWDDARGWTQRLPSSRPPSRAGCRSLRRGTWTRSVVRRRT